MPRGYVRPLSRPWHLWASQAVSLSLPGLTHAILCSGRSSMKIHAIQTGRVQIKAAHVRARRDDRADRLRDVLDDLEWVDPLPILCWAIEH